MDRLLAPTDDWSMTIASGCSFRNAPWISELLPEPATPVMATRTPVGMSTETFRRLCTDAFRTGSAPEGLRTVSFNGRRDSMCRPVSAPDASKPENGPA